VIPAYNAGRFIAEALDSIFRQSGFSLDVIVVDDSSTDATPQAVADYGRGVRLRSVPHAGAAAARNAGVRLAEGKYLAFLDADDVWTPLKLERQIRLLTTPPGADMVFGYCQDFHDPALTPGERSQIPCRPDPYPLQAPDTCLLERETFLRIGDFPEVEAGESVAWCGWAQTLGSRIAVLPETCVLRRMHLHNTTRDRRSLAGYPAAAKWLLDRRRQAKGTVKA
jgi:glycosyltransferase involved in cell wall biosynthesis